MLVISTRRHIDARVDDLRDRHAAEVVALQAEIDRRFEALYREVQTRDRALGERLKHMNEFRDAMREQATLMVSESLFDAVTKRLSERVSLLEAALNRQRGRAAVYAGISGFVVLLLTLVTLAVNHIRL